MRESFTSSMNTANTAAIEGAALDSFLSEVEKDFGGKEAAAEVFELQKKKAKIMERLHESLALIDTEGTVGVEGTMPHVTHDGESLQMVINGRRTDITEGQLLVAGLWNEDHFLDGDVPRAFQKKYATQKARNQIAALYDKQIAYAEANQVHNKGTGRDEAFSGIAHRKYEGKKIPDGILAEQMVQSFFTKLTHDHNMPFTLESATSYEDVMYKIDFFIRPKDQEAVGVGVEEPQDIPEIAIQFTTDTRDATIEHKKNQIKNAKGLMAHDQDIKARDLILVTLPMKQVRSVYNQWRVKNTDERAPGGPDELWDERTKATVFVKILQEILPKDDIISAWQSTK